MIVGIDEVGYSSWAGPLTVAGTILFKKSSSGYNDSKKFTNIDNRIRYVNKLTDNGTKFETCLVFISPYYVDNNGLHASERLAVDIIRNHFKDNYYIMDGKYTFGADESLVKGDEKIDSIAFSSLIAKIARDRVMMTHELAGFYDWDHNMGYMTRKHKDLVIENGYSDFHRIERWGVKVTDKVSFYASNWSTSGWLITNDIIDKNSDDLYDMLTKINVE